MANRHRRRFLSSDTYCYDCDFSPPPFSDSDSSSPPHPPSPFPSPSPSLQSSPYYYPHPPPPPVSHTFKVSKSSKNITLIVVLFLCALAIAFLFLSYLTVRKQRNSRNISRRRRRTTRNEEIENPANLDLDLLNGDQSPVIDHPIWYIRTVGLQKSVIDSITIFKYKRGESLIEGADCSVCLSEFEEDETLRLLPKCSHAFHIHCIDTWLSSHQNCPLCRAPIVSSLSVSDSPNTNSTVITISDQAQLDDAAVVTVHPDPESLMNSHSQRVDHVVPDEINVRLAVDQFSVEEEDQDRVSGVLYHKEEDHLTQGRNSEGGGTRVMSDLGDHRRSVLKEEEEEGSEGAGRRSVSLDASSAAYLTSSFLTIAKAGGEGCSSNHEPAAASAAAALKNNNKKKTKSNSLMDGNQDGDKIMTSRVTKTYSFGRFLQRGSSVHDTDLKRSTSSASASSSGGFFSLSSKH